MGQTAAAAGRDETADGDDDAADVGWRRATARQRWRRKLQYRQRAMATVKRGNVEKKCGENVKQEVGTENI